MNCKFIRDYFNIHKGLPSSHPQTLGFKARAFILRLNVKALGSTRDSLQGTLMAGNQTGFLTLPAAPNTCALCVAIPSKFDVATVLPWTLSPAVLSCFGNLFTFENFFIAAGAIPPQCLGPAVSRKTYILFTCLP